MSWTKNPHRHHYSNKKKPTIYQYDNVVLDRIRITDLPAMYDAEDSQHLSYIRSMTTTEH